jgi:hypothetical protein
MRRVLLEDKSREQLKIFKNINKYWKNGLKNITMQYIDKEGLYKERRIIYYLIRIT